MTDINSTGTLGTAGAIGTAPCGARGVGGPGGAENQTNTNGGGLSNTVESTGGQGGVGGSGGAGSGVIGGANAGAGGVGGAASAAATTSVNSTSTVSSGATATGGQGGQAGTPGTGSAETGKGASGGAGAAASEVATLAATSGVAAATATSAGRNGGAGNGSGRTGGAGGPAAAAGATATETIATGGAGGTATTGTVTATGYSATATVVQTSGTGGRDYNGASGGAGASSTLINAVSGRTTGGTPELLRRATGATGGYSGGGTAGKAGSATSSLTFDDVAANPTQANLLRGASAAAGGATLGGEDTNSLSINGTLAAMNATLATLHDTDGTVGSDPITVNATDQLGFTAAQKTIAATINARPTFSAPASAVIGVNHQTFITSISLTENGNTTGERATVTVSDTHRLLAVGNSSGVTLGGNDGTGLTISGGFASVQSALGTLLDTDGTTGSDTITLNATDSLGNSATAKTITVAVASGTVLPAPTAATVGVGQSSAITGVSVSETGGAAGETFTITLADTQGLLLATASGAAVLGNDDTASMSVSGSLIDVNNTLATDKITVNATDGFGDTARAKTTSVTVNGLPSILLPSSDIMGVTQIASIPGVSVSEMGNTTSENLWAPVTDTTGVLSASIAVGASVAGGGTNDVLIIGTFAHANAPLATLTDREGTVGSDTIHLNATDGFGNVANPPAIGLTVNGLQTLAAPSAVTVGVGEPLTIARVGLSETGTTTRETFSVTLSDTHSVLSAFAPDGGSVSGPGVSRTISGSLVQVNAALGTLSDTDNTLTSDTIALNAMDSLGNSAVATSIAVSVANGPVIAVPSSVVIGVSELAKISGISVSESGGAATETYSVTVSDGLGLLITINTGGAGVTGGGSTDVTFTGTLTQVTTALAHLDDTDGTAGPDKLTVNATDGFGNVARQQTAAITVNGLPVLTAPTAETIGICKAASITGGGLTESGTTAGETFTATADVAVVTNNACKDVTISGSLGAVSTALGSLSDTDGTVGPDTITANASDSFGSAAAQTTTITVNGLPVLTARSATTVAQSQATAVAGVSVSESGNTTTSGETFSILLTDTHGVLAANSGATGGGSITPTNDGLALAIDGTEAQVQVNVDLSTLAHSDASIASDAITVSASDSFGNSGAQTDQVSGISLSESPVANSETFTAVLSDANGVLSANTSATGGGGPITPSNGGKTLTISDMLAQVNADLSTLADHDASTASVTINASDSKGGAATPASIPVTINGLPLLTALAAETLGVGKATSIAGVSLSESGNTTGETSTVTVADSTGLLSVTAGAAVAANSASKGATISGSLGAVSTALCTLSDTDGTAGPDMITVNARDSFGNAAAQTATAITGNGLPVLTAPTAETVTQGQATSIAGINLSESGDTTGETFAVTLADINGDLSAAGAGVSGSGTPNLTITGSLAQVNADLETLEATDNLTPSDAITLYAKDSFGNTAATATIAVSVLAPAGQTFILTKGVDVVQGGPDNNIIIAGSDAPSTEDLINGGTGGTNTLELTGAGAFAVDGDCLRPGPIRRVRVDLSSRCNLRCVYCAVSHPNYKGTDMNDADAERVVSLIVELARHNCLDPVDLNGHGETTFRQGWTEICFALIERGIRMRLTSNFAKAFDENELEALACMDSISISIDTADRKLLQNLRRRVDLRQIVTNMALVKAAALKLHRAPPIIGFLCGLYDKNTLDWESFARFAVASGVINVHLWSLTAHPDLDVSEGERVLPLDDLSDSELRPRMLSVLRGLKLLQRHNVSVVVQGGFIETLARRVDLDAGASPQPLHPRGHDARLH